MIALCSVVLYNVHIMFSGTSEAARVTEFYRVCNEGKRVCV